MTYFRTLTCSSHPRAGLTLALVGLAITLGVPAAASAAAPVVTTTDVVSTGESTATVEGDFNPGGLETSYWVDYDLADSGWCTSGGTSPSAPPPHMTEPELGFDDATFHAVSVNLDVTTGLAYCAWLVANNSAG